MDITHAYYIAKTGHLISLLIWVGGMIGLGIMLTVHASAKNTVKEASLIAAEKTLLRCWLNPAMIGVFLFGFWLIFITGAGGPGTGSWMHVKLLVAVFGMGVLHMMLAKVRRKLEVGDNTKSTRYIAMKTWAVAVLTAVLVVLVVFKPF